jgi:hypothetical protein
VGSKSSLGLVIAVVVAALVAAFHRPSSHVSRPAEEPPRAGEPSHASLDDPEEPELPPGHPSIGDRSTPLGPAEGETDAPPAVVWKVPATWKVVPNPNAMRLATYHVPAATGAADEAEMSVSRAGGSTDANIERWIGQFADAGQASRGEKEIRGLKVSLVEVSGTYQGGMSGSAPTSRRGWTLKGAVVEAEDGAYFFKLTGPTASVRAAHRDFDALVQSMSPMRAASPL